MVMSDFDLRRDNDCANNAFDDRKPVAYDWEDKGLYNGDEVIRFYVSGEEILVLDDRREITNFINEFFNPEPETIGE
ncbi:hypothetical protein [Lapidilactobacillus bayanensis]|uniref:hypothetical protein n=1 Tax=Lapidilactobacillus bayanensis TaxID=2485998 RepID=UPI000F7B0B49|nr:hypothetical protein [Lapidilactobacillus bayanensis]